jgi:hypothetical protein
VSLVVDSAQKPLQMTSFVSRVVYATLAVTAWVTGGESRSGKNLSMSCDEFYTDAGDDLVW